MTPWCLPWPCHSIGFGIGIGISIGIGIDFGIGICNGITMANNVNSLLDKTVNEAHTCPGQPGRLLPR